MNIEHRTSNIRHRSDGNQKGLEPSRIFDLEERLLNYAARIVRLVERLPRTRAGAHLADQLLRSGTAPLLHHGEAQGAESPRDFQHKLRLCLKESREAERTLRLIERVPLVKPPTRLSGLLSETDELIRIFVASIRTSEEKQPLSKRRR